MLDFLFDTTITIKRRSGTVLDEYGQYDHGDINNWTLVYSNIKARIEHKEQTHSQFEYNYQGQRYDTPVKIYVEKDKTNIGVHDAVFDHNGSFMGFVAGIYKAYGPNSSICHFELTIENK